LGVIVHTIGTEVFALSFNEQTIFTAFRTFYVDCRFLIIILNLQRNKFLHKSGCQEKRGFFNSPRSFYKIADQDDYLAVISHFLSMMVHWYWYE